MLAGLEEKDLEQKLPAEANTHVMLVFLKEKKVINLLYLSNSNTNCLQLYIYDPNFEATIPRELTAEEKEKMAAEKRKKKDWRPRLGEISSGTRLRNLYKGIKGKFAVEEIWMGGGGNQDIQCLAMCQDQLELMENDDEEAMNFAWAEEQLREQLHVLFVQVVR